MAVKKKKTLRTRKKHRALASFLPPVSRWFDKTFEKPSPAQVKAWPKIRKGDHTLLLAPTGSGKTLAAFLCAIDRLFRQAEEGTLEDGIQVLYISPLKALGNDIHKNLLEPLAGIRKESRGKLPDLKVAVRTGDTSQSERARMIRKPPHILITTPESLYLLLGGKKMAPNLKSIRAVIVDEVHAMCDNKRGVHLAVSLERLQGWIGRPFQRIGCSATLSPLDEIAAYLAGSDSNGKPRPCTIVDAGMRKKLDVQVVAPLPDFLEAGHNALWTSAYELLLSEIAGHDTTLVFSNSRYKAERTSLRLGELQSTSPQHSVNIGVHHGSMSKEIRLEAEDDLKAGKLDALIATSSLELGIDVGSINLVYQLESTKSVATGLQRIGRAGHLLDRTSKGRILVFERDDLLEAGSVCKAMMDGEIDAIQIPAGCLDVLAQQIVGAVAFQDWQANDLLKLIRQAYPYQGLSEQKYEMVLSMLAGDFPFEMSMAPKSLLHWDRATGRLSAGRSSAHISAMCVGTISDASEYDVVIDGSKKRVGRVQSEFVDDCLRVGDVFVLGSTAWRVTGVRRNQLLVKEAPGSTPTVPWWHGHVEPRTVEVGERIGRMRREIAERIDDPDVTLWLEKEYQMCPNAARAAVDYVHEQVLVTGMVPTHDRLLLEIWRDELGKTNLILHSPFGERINRTWGAAICAAAKNDRHENWSAAATNDLLLLTLQKNTARQLTVVHAEEMLSLVTSDTVEKLAVQAADDGGIFGSTFREVAENSFQILRAYGGKRVPFWLQNYRAGELFEATMKRRDYPVIAEVLRVYLEEALDVPGLKKLLNSIHSGEAEMIYKQVESPSPFTHSMLVKDMYRGDYQMGRDRRANLLRVHRQVLQQVLNEEQMADLLDSRAIERIELRLLHLSEASRARSPDELASAIRDLGDPPASVSVLQEIVDGDTATMLGQLLKDGRIVACEIPDVEMDPVRLVSADLWREYHEAFTPTRRGQKLQVILPRLENGEFAGFDAAPADKHIPARWRRKVPVDEARKSVIERHKLGFRFDKPDRMTCPAPGRPLDVPLAKTKQTTFLPYYEEPSPIQVGPDWTLSRASDVVRPVLAQFVSIMTEQLERTGWELEWNLHGPHGRYREFGRYTVHVRQKVINVTLSVPRFREEGRNRGYHRWLSIKAKEGISEDLLSTLLEWMNTVEELTDHYYALQDSFSEGQRAASQERSIPMEDILINRAPVLTLWGAVAAERLGYDEDASLTLGKCLAGLNAQTKGRMLGIYGQPKGPDGGPPKKVGLGEEFWVEICGRPLPAKNTEDGIRAVIKDKPIDPASVDRYIASKFGDHLDAARKAMTELAESFTVEEFQENAYELYEQFRPVIPKGKAGWGAKGKLDLALIRSLVE